ncbi:MAG: hypothetical protein J6I45_07580 [Clostridia bacterium]|nr:hypothetical protein [Clostridia bacterium]
MKKLLNDTTMRLFIALGTPIVAVLGYTMLSVMLATTEDKVYLMQAVPLMMENALAALTVLIGGGLIYDIAQKKSGNCT